MGMEMIADGWFHIVRSVVAVVGILYLLRLLFRVITEVIGVFRAYVLAPLGIGRLQLKKFGPWAVVTGASEGIGRGYALELARQGLNVVIMSRSEEKLNKVSKEIKEKYQREVLVIPVDFSHGQDVYPSIAEKLKDLEIGVLVNNVGINIGADYLTLLPSKDIQRLVEVNVQSVTQLTRLLLPKMVERKKGVVVNISSAGSLRSVPLLVPYCASKVFLNFLTEGLCKEYSSKGIITQTVIPYVVDTAMSRPYRSAAMTAFVTDPISYARAAVASIGILNFTPGCLSHTIQGYILNLFPESVMDKEGTKMLENLTNTALQGKKKE